MAVKDGRASTAGGKAYDRIRSLILAGDFGPGDRLKEEELTTLCEGLAHAGARGLAKAGV